MDELKCPICGEPTFVYYGNARKDRLCKKHASDLRAGLIAQCEKCGEWREADKPCPKCNPAKEAPTKVEQAQDAPKITCLLCGADSNGYHFCKSCYRKYSKKELLIKIVECVSPCAEIMSETYANEKIYRCTDGHVVKSQAEREIDSWLYKNRIIHAYEKPLDVGETKPLHPDFFLEDYLGTGKSVFIEYFGVTGSEEYRRQTSYKMPLYKKAGITLICMYAQTDLKDLEYALETKLNKQRIKEGKINFEEK